AARAQQRAMPVIGILSGQTESGNLGAISAFRQGLGQQGYVEGRNVEILYRWGETQSDRLPGLAADLIRRRVNLIFAGGGIHPLLAAKSATAAPPIVFVAGTDPVRLGLVASLNRPGGNVTGVVIMSQALVAKRLELLHEMVPAATSIGFLLN